MKLNAIILPTKPRSKVNHEALAEKGKQRMKLIEDQKRQKQMEWVQNMAQQQGATSPLRVKEQKFSA